MSKKSSEIEQLSFEQAVKELEQVVALLESPDLALAESLAAYQRGAALMKHAQSLLSQVQSEIEVIEAGQTRTIDRSDLIAQSGDR
jgi:exodeoxyribonuclease VII small subunit